MIRYWLTKRKLRKLLDGCNYEMVKTLLVRNFSGGVIPNELARLLDKFIDNPCYDTAVDLIKHDSGFISFFELARRGGFTEHLFKSGEIK